MPSPSGRIDALLQRAQQLRATPLEQRNTFVLRLLASTERALGEELLASGAGQEALAHLTEALRLFELVSGRDELAALSYRIASVAETLGEYPLAESALQWAASHADAAKDQYTDLVDDFHQRHGF